MTTIVWDKVGEKFYESGVSRGVFYGHNSRGFAWNGLISVDSKSVDDVDSLYIDGIKYTELVTLGDFEGSITAYTYPDEFLPFQGVWEAQAGFFLENQPKERFGLSYRTEIHNDLGQSVGYKIHLLYNLLAIPQDKTYETMSLDTEASEFEWDITAIPEAVDNFRPTAYVILDSTKLDPYLLSDLEEILYGTAETDPKLPDLNGLVTFALKWGRLIIVDHGDGTWTAESPVPGVIEMLDATTFEITANTAVYLDAETYTLTSSAQNLEDLWPP